MDQYQIYVDNIELGEDPALLWFSYTNKKLAYELIMERIRLIRSRTCTDENAIEVLTTDHPNNLTVTVTKAGITVTKVPKPPKTAPPTKLPRYKEDSDEDDDD